MFLPPHSILHDFFNERNLEVPKLMLPTVESMLKQFLQAKLHPMNNFASEVAKHRLTQTHV